MGADGGEARKGGGRGRERRGEVWGGEEGSGWGGVHEVGVEQEMRSLWEGSRLGKGQERRGRGEGGRGKRNRKLLHDPRMRMSLCRCQYRGLSEQSSVSKSLQPSPQKSTPEARGQPQMLAALSCRGASSGRAFATLGALDNLDVFVLGRAPGQLRQDLLLVLQRHRFALRRQVRLFLQLLGDVLPDR